MLLTAPDCTKAPITLDFTGKRVLITGGTRGIGRAIAESYRAAGAHVAINGSSSESVAAAVEYFGGDIVGIPASVADPAACETLVNTAIDKLGGLDILINNAGTGGGGGIDAMPLDTWHNAIATNLSGAYFCSRYALPALRESPGANILQIASVYGLVGVAGASAYCAAKGGLVNLTRAMAVELADAEIRVNCLCPGGVDTDMLRDLAVRLAGSVEAGYDILKRDAPARRICAPYEMASAALWLTSDHAQFITGSIHSVDGAESSD